MTLIENIEIQSLTLVEQASAPASPAAGDQTVYIRTSDHHLVRKGSGGAVVDMEAGGGGGGGPLGIAVFSASGGTISGATYSGSIASVTRISAGVYQVNFSPSVTGAYAVALAASDDNVAVMTTYLHGTSLGSSSFQFVTADTTGPTARDPDVVTVTVFQ